MMVQRILAFAGIALAVLQAQPVAQAAPLAPMLERPALQVAHPERSVLLDVARAGKRLVAVGERGIAIFSDDNGKTWTQAKVPVSVTLVALAFADERHGWAVGHSGVILRSDDGGATWAVQLDGKQAAQLVLDAATASTSAQAAGLQKLGRLLVQDGPDKPFLDVVFSDAENGWVVGAYGLIFRTRDGGRHWQPWLDHVDNPEGLHIYALRYDAESGGKRIYLAGEQGYFARSNDGGEHFQRIATPYEGSYFDMAVLPGGELLLGGLRGNLWRSQDHGGHFDQIPAAPVSWNMIRPLADGRVVLFNQAGSAFEIAPGASAPQPLVVPPGLPLTGLAVAANAHYAAVGLGGVTLFDSLKTAATANSMSNKSSKP
jgi:photosystem II stability/assembly factor-like uncharacterized protein